jgi:pyridoxal phosphate enzyme (YggS family)
MRLAENLRLLEERIEAARRRGGWPDRVTLVAVTKDRPAAAIREALALGIGEIGENRVQEAKRKWPELTPAFAHGGTRRHMIGHLQRNKVAAALELFDVIQSVDSLRLARKISDLAAAGGRRLPVLVQVNGGNEETKYGVPPEELGDAVTGCAALPGLEVAGVMALAPLAADEARLRAIFAGMRERFERLRAAHPELRLEHLSMGMSNDFEIAVEEGSTMVRIGSALFADP